MDKTTEKDIETVVNAYKGKQPEAPLDPDVVVVCAAAMKPNENATPEERHTFENMRNIITGTKPDKDIETVVNAYKGKQPEAPIDPDVRAAVNAYKK